ncbi:hypothetical protein [Thalassotalea sp. PP2-459]|uniref:hypothetical protein n=1 Tax=Thalassotalea sp. PP2-459 TaxID=1742724 RepID=UPI00094537EF|nr:hypothetical protein [Thalassotalea sp. PP2-459]OKY27257.1 hypothetical protein BI291_00025 [Thalassotalea sp. PP2-459]
MDDSIHKVFEGSWTYRSFKNDIKQIDPKDPIENLLFGMGTIEIETSKPNILQGRIYGPQWSLNLTGNITYGNPFTIDFQGKGIVGSEKWIYNYIGYLANSWSNGIDQTPTIIGSIVRTIPHSNSNGGTNPAGVVASWFAVKQ